MPVRHTSFYICTISIKRSRRLIVSNESADFIAILSRIAAHEMTNTNSCCVSFSFFLFLSSLRACFIVLLRETQPSRTISFFYYANCPVIMHNNTFSLATGVGRQRSGKVYICSKEKEGKNKKKNSHWRGYLG